MTTQAGLYANPAAPSADSGRQDGHIGPVAARATAAGGLSWIDGLTLFAIGLVVVLVSVPRLRSFALRENEFDAMRMLRTLASQPAAPGADARTCNLAALVAPDTSLQRKLEDLELLADGRVRRHGYLFDLVLLRPGEPMLRAWPWKHAQTGRAAFVWTPQRGLVGCENSAGQFSGLQHPPELPAEPLRDAALGPQAAPQAEPGAAGQHWVRIPRR